MTKRAIILVVILVLGFFLVLISQKGGKAPIRKAVVGLESPDFTFLEAGGGGAIRLSQLKGKKVFVHFWASWCKECREEMPGIQDLYNRKKNDPGFVFISVIYREDPAKSIKYLKDNNYDIPVYIDPGEKAVKDYGVTAVPETFIIDKKGILSNRIIGPGRWDEI
jgi:thiol-disulfide isomerase/thioredoxin